MRTAITQRGGEETQIAFGPFLVRVPERQLLCDGHPLPIGSRALDILVELARQPGRVVGKSELMRAVWGDLNVEEGALRVHVSALRKALGGRYIMNVPGRGYSLAVGSAELHQQHGEATETAMSKSHLPAQQRVIGRDDQVGALVEKLERRHFVSLVGPGGIGKTTVALAALHRLEADPDLEIHFIGLSSVAGPKAVATAIASSLGMTPIIGETLPAIVTFLQHSPCLLVLDSCEHVVEEAATLAEAIRSGAPQTKLLITTREPLRTADEHVIRLPPLTCPPKSTPMTSAECSAYPAAALFIHRVETQLADFRLTDADVPALVTICNELDGIALALELCAGHVDAYGLAGTASQLERRLDLLWQGRRTAPHRHRTLQAALDWSHDLLDDRERKVFAGLGVFADVFTLDVAERVLTDEHLTARDVARIVASLVAKSLVSRVPGPFVRFRLLDTTRAYASEKLQGLANASDVARRHALYLIDQLEPSSIDVSPDQISVLQLLPDARLALVWCFSEYGDPSVGVSLVSRVATPMLENALCDECLRWTEHAISKLDGSQRGSHIELDLQIAMGWSAMSTPGRGQTVYSAFVRGLEIAESGHDAYQRLSLLNGLSFILSRMGDHVASVRLAEQAALVARDTADTSAIALADWALGISHHLCGHQRLVLDYCASAVTPPVRSPYIQRVANYGYDPRGRALIARARALWLTGFPDQAQEAVNFAFDAVKDVSHPISTFDALVAATSVFIWCGLWAVAKAMVGRLLNRSEIQGLIYRDIGAALGAVVELAQDNNAASLDAARTSLDRLIERNHLIFVPMCRAALVEALIVARRSGEALAVLGTEPYELSLQQVDGPETLRVSGLLTASLGNPEDGERKVRQAIALAREQGALAFELRSVMSLVELTQGVSQVEALGMLAVTYARFTEGHATADLRKAALKLGLRQAET